MNKEERLAGADPALDSEPFPAPVPAPRDFRRNLTMGKLCGIEVEPLQSLGPVVRAGKVISHDEILREFGLRWR